MRSILDVDDIDELGILHRLPYGRAHIFGLGHRRHHHRHFLDIDACLRLVRLFFGDISKRSGSHPLSSRRHMACRLMPTSSAHSEAARVTPLMDTSRFLRVLRSNSLWVQNFIFSGLKPSPRFLRYIINPFFQPLFKQNSMKWVTSSRQKSSISMDSASHFFMMLWKT